MADSADLASEMLVDSSDLAALYTSEALDEESDDDEIASKFNSNVNTFPRICNIILDHPCAL